MSNKYFTPGTVVDSPWLNDVNNATYDWVTNVGAAANNYVGNCPASLTLTAGVNLYFVPINGNSAASTLTLTQTGLNSPAIVLPTKNITKYGTTALVAGDLVSGVAAELYYDGTQFQLLNPQATITAAQITNALPSIPGRLITVRKITATGTYTPTAGTNSVVVDLVGGGGGGGGTTAGVSGGLAAGGGGGSGAYSRSYLTSGFSGVTVTIGAGGTGAANANGTSGGQTSFGGLVTAPGGAGGSNGASAAASAVQTLSAASPGTGNIIAQSGNTPSVFIIIPAMTVATQGQGAVSALGGGATFASFTSSALGGSSAPATSYGCGGNGGASIGVQVATAGGSGAPGVCIIYEYS